MNRDSVENAFDGTNAKLDDTAQRKGRDGDGDPIIPREDRLIVRGFPWFVAAVLAIWFVAVVYLQEFDVPGLIELLCLSFVFCFAILGLPCSLMMSRGLFPGWIISLLAVALSTVLWVYSNIAGSFSFAVAIDDMLGVIGIDLPRLWGEVVGYLGTLAVVLFTSIGVTSVISAYMRTYTPDVFTTMNAHAREGVRGKAERFFMVPEIIDVEEVVLDPPAGHAFDIGKAVSISTYLFIMGMLISSYLFVNPYFLDTMGWKTMLSITIMLSMFTPALILPWQIVRSVGAKVRSSAPRDYYLWDGAKHRLFSSFTALGAFMMMFLLSVYLGHDTNRILLNYVSFLLPLLVTSVMYGVLYANNFESTDRRIICEGFEKRR